MKPQGDLIGERRAEVRALQRIGIGVINSGAVAVELVGEGVEVEEAASSGERSVAIGRGEISSGSAEAEFGSARTAGAGKDLDDAGHGVGAVERTLRAAKKFHAIRLRKGKRAEIEGAAGFVYGDALDDPFVVA